MKVKDSIIVIRKAILCHIKNPEIRQFLYGLLSYEMISYIFFGVFTAIIDYCVYAFLSVLRMNVMFSNALSWLCAVIFSFSTNRRWVFKMGFDNIKDVLHSFNKFVCARFATLIMTEVMLLIAQLAAFNIYRTKIFAMILTVIINYIISKLFIFK